MEEQITTPEALREEMNQIIGNPAHPHHEGYKRGLPATNEYISGIYKRVHGSGQVDLDPSGLEVGKRSESSRADPKADVEGHTDGADTEAGDKAFIAEVDTASRERWGEGYAEARSSARAGWDRLLHGVDEGAVGEMEDRILDTLPPGAEVRAHVETAQYLADLDRLWHAPESLAPAGQESAGFAPQLDAALRAEFGNAHDAVRAGFQATVQHLFHFAGGDKALAAIERRLNTLPVGARVQAYVLTARFLDTLTRLRQSQS